MRGDFFDGTRPVKERIDDLLSELTPEEKITMVSCRMPDIERLGIKGVNLGGEAAHGVQQRNDERRDGVNVAVKTTSFPQPVGMSASWDRELLHAAGEITGIEARLNAMKDNLNGLSRWAPTVDLLRDPRWGRNEEGYGEDPYLTGELAGSYVRGMQGDDPAHHLRIASTLKHFYANNVEDGRGYKDSVFHDRDKFEYYLGVFRRVIRRGGAEAVMTSYNKINGVPGMVNTDVRDILKKEFGLVHAVSDGGAPTLLHTEHHYSEDEAVGIADSLKSGVDGLTDNPQMIEDLVRQAVKKGLLTEKDLDTAIRNTMTTRIKLGVYDREPVNPYADLSGESIGSDYASRICKELTDASLVLLKNNGALPLDGSSLTPSDVLLAGPMGDRWDQDWYCGEPMHRISVKAGLEALLGGSIEFTEGFDRVRLQSKDGKFSGEYILEDWGENCNCFRDIHTGKLLSARLEAGEVEADKTSSFEWFPTTVFSLDQREDGYVSLVDFKKRRILVNENGELYTEDQSEASQRKEGAEGELQRTRNRVLDDRIPDNGRFTLTVTESGRDVLRKKAEGKKVILLCFGNQPLVKAREGVDRTKLALPDVQDRLWREAVKIKAGSTDQVNVILTMTANYPYGIKEADEAVDAILLSATGSQDLGTSLADALFGNTDPAGRLSQTWPVSEQDLPPMDDYALIDGGRTYRFSDKKPLYPFGYGLTYTDFEYLKMKALYVPGEGILVRVKIRNSGKRTGDEVVQLYGKAPSDRGVTLPKKQLLDFARVKGMRPGEIREVTFRVDPEEFAYYDEKTKGFVLLPGEYGLFAGRSSADEALTGTVTLYGN